MIEVLVAVLVLAVGLLGVAGVQLVSMQQTVNSTLRSEATMHAHTVVERLRSNGDATSLSTTELDALEAHIRADLGATADLTVTMNSSATAAVVTVQWEERDPFSGEADGLADQTLTVNAGL